jgi:hypothetical protein
VLFGFGPGLTIETVVLHSVAIWEWETWFVFIVLYYLNLGWTSILRINMEFNMDHPVKIIYR